METINFDHISANPLLPEVKAAMIEAIESDYGNPSSHHKKGDQAAKALDVARQSVAALLNCTNPKEIVFTSGGTESINHAIKGVAMANASKGKHIITSNIEHNSVIKSLRRLKGQGYKVTSVSVDSYGRVNPDEIKNAITDETILVSIMHSNNEIGTIQPIAQIAEITRAKKIILHTDAVDSVGIIPMDVQALGADIVSFASNSFYGPTGVGGLYISRGTRIFPILDGGAQEGNKRAGAENMIGIIGMGVAAQIAAEKMDERTAHFKLLKDKLLRELPDYIDEYNFNGHMEESLPNLLSVSIKYIEGESVVLMLDDENVAASTRSACASGSLRSSHVLQSIGVDYADAQGTLLVSFGIDNTEDEIPKFLEALKRTVKTLRDISPLCRTSN
ncbi:cysteine desulfurase family protein [Desulfobacterales bacterium HSG16]|nr:cysteine desulfurase family protein [Desulfobacterales bacterium HSG16]